MKSRAITFWFAVLLMFSGAMVLWYGWKRMAAATDRDWFGGQQVAERLSENEPAGDEAPISEFTLFDQRARRFSSSELHGKVWVASFFFTSCPSACRMQNTEVAKLHRQFHEEDVHFVSITCDPQRDTPSKLAAYADLFSANPDRWHFLTGDLDYIKRIAHHMMQIALEKETHSSRLFVFDQHGVKRESFLSSNPDEMVELSDFVQQLVANGAQNISENEAESFDPKHGKDQRADAREL